MKPKIAIMNYIIKLNIPVIILGNFVEFKVCIFCEHQAFENCFEFLNFVAEGYRRKLNHDENFSIYGIQMHCKM